MTNLFHRLKRLPFYLSSAFFISAVFLVIINILTLIPAPQMTSLYEGFTSEISALFGILAGAFINYAVCKNTKKAIFSISCIALFDLVLYSLCGVHISFVFSIILSLIFAMIFEKQSLFYAFIICALISFVIALFFGLFYDYLYSFLKSFCAALKGRGAIFGAVNNAYSLLFSDNLSKLFYHKDYSGSAYSNGKIISGVIDIFSAQKVAGINASKYLSGKYFVNIFLSSGVFALIYQKLEREQKNAFFLTFLLAVIFGDVRLLALFLLIWNPLMYLGYLFMISVSYFTAYLLDIRLVFFREGSVFELFRYRDKLGYFILAGIVLSILTYFLESIILSKFDYQSRKILPYDVRKIVSALGGDRNIEKVDNASVILRNPNLIDILKLDCEIRGKTVTLHPDDFKILKEFF